MRIILTILASISFLFPRAQTHLPAGSLSYSPWEPVSGYIPLTYNDSSHSDRAWHLTKYASLSAGYGFSAGSSFLSAPMGLLLSRPLNKNVYAFAGISAAPVLFSINRLLTDPALNPAYPGYNSSSPYHFGYNSRVEMGLMYINDAKTFSISGSIGVERGSYPVYPSTKTSSK